MKKLRFVFFFKNTFNNHRNNLTKCIFNFHWCHLICQVLERSIKYYRQLYKGHFSSFSLFDMVPQDDQCSLYQHLYLSNILDIFNFQVFIYSNSVNGTHSIQQEHLLLYIMTPLPYIQIKYSLLYQIFRQDLVDQESLHHRWPHCSVIDRRTWGSARSSLWPQLLKHCPSSAPRRCTCPVPIARRAWWKDRQRSRGRAPQHSSAPLPASPHLSLQSKESQRPATTAKSELTKNKVTFPYQWLLRELIWTFLWRGKILYTGKWTITWTTVLKPQILQFWQLPS